MSESKISVISQSPYFDDYDPAKDYVRVLFRPSYPVQARELTTLQTFLQEQVTRFGNHIFKDGARITAAEATVSNDVIKLVLSGTGNALYPPAGAEAGAILTDITTFEGLTITNSTGTVKAQVVKQPVVNTQSFLGNMYIKYTTEETFDSDGGYIYAKMEDNPGLITANYYNTYSAKTPATIVNVAQGVYFVKGIFTRVEQQTIVIDENSSTPTADIGFKAYEDIVTQNEDDTIFDNSRGTSNEGSPGAHRLKIRLAFAVKLDEEIDDEGNFYKIMRVEDGRVVDKTSISDDYSVLRDELARRTFDESGHYALRPFTHTVATTDSDSAFEVKIGPSKAYVAGYEITKLAPTRLRIDKGLNDTKTVTNYKVPFTGTPSVEVTNVSGNLPGQLGDNPYLHRNRLLLKNSNNDTIGVARAYVIQQEFDNFVPKLKMYIYDVKMFTVITVQDAAFKNALSTGSDVQSLKTRGYVYLDDGTAGVTGDSFTVINSNGTFRVNQKITSSMTTTTSRITGLTTFNVNDIVGIDGAAGTGFSCDVVAGTFGNTNSSLVQVLDKHIKSLKSGSTIMDNDFEIINYTGAPATAIPSGNGQWDVQRVDDEEEIEKKIKFAYLKVKNVNSSDREGANYGWSASDREITLKFPDVHKVYKVNQTADGEFDTGRFERINITTSGIIAQGSIVKGKTSGTEAYVALSNTTAITPSIISNIAGWHMTEKGTGSNSILEVIFKKGVEFTTGEEIEVIAPDLGEQSEFTYNVTYNSVVPAVGKDVTALFKLDNGQRSEYYDIGRLVRKDNSPAPSNDIVIFYSYFEADATNNHYYSVDSYSNVDFFRYDVRRYEDTQEIVPKTTDTGSDLRNAIDFRFRALASSDITTSPFIFSTRGFQNQSRIKPQTSFTTDITQYLGRIDIITIDKNALITEKKGIPAEKPKRPVEDSKKMTLSFVIIPPAVRYPQDEVFCEIKDNKRYTMRDIGKLESRIKNVESAVALSLLESQALHDDLEGRTKSGFVTDDFSVEYTAPASAAEFDHEDFRAAIDTINRELIPSQTDGVPLDVEITGTSNISTFYRN